MDDLKREVDRLFSKISEKAYQLIGRPVARALARTGIRVTKNTKSNFKSSIKEVQENGPTKELESTDPLSASEMSELASKCDEAGIKIAIKEIDVNKNHEKRSKSKGEVKKIIRKERRRKQTNRIRSRIGVKQKYTKSEKMYIAYCNVSQLGGMTRILEKMSKERLLKETYDDIPDRNNDGVKDEKDVTINMNKVKIDVADLKEPGTQFGREDISLFKNNYVTQIVTKDEFADMSEDLHTNLNSYGAILKEDDKVSIRVSKNELQAFQEIAPSKPIIEYGSAGGRKVHSIQSDNELEVFHFNKEHGEKDLEIAKERFQNDDYIISYDPQKATIEMIVDKKSFEKKVAEHEKKFSAEVLLEEAKAFNKEHGKETIDILDDKAEIEMPLKEDFGEKEVELE